MRQGIQGVAYDTNAYLKIMEQVIPTFSPLCVTLEQSQGW